VGTVSVSGLIYYSSCRRGSLSLPRGSLTLTSSQEFLQQPHCSFSSTSFALNEFTELNAAPSRSGWKTLFRNYVTSRQAEAASDSVVVVAPFQGVSCNSIAQQRTRSLRATAMMAFFLRFFWLAQIL
jgi:hypothetical protein